MAKQREVTERQEPPTPEPMYTSVTTPPPASTAGQVRNPAPDPAAAILPRRRPDRSTDEALGLANKISKLLALIPEDVRRWVLLYLIHRFLPEMKVTESIISTLGTSIAPPAQ